VTPGSVCALVAIAGCAATARSSGPVTPTAVKEVVRQEMVVARSLDSVLGRRPPPIPETRYYLHSPDGDVCEVDYIQYLAVHVGDRVSCRWAHPPSEIAGPS
jgi:hypothetical protein